jgi:hypothetical protein
LNTSENTISDVKLNIKQRKYRDRYRRRYYKIKEALFELKIALGANA